MLCFICHLLFSWASQRLNQISWLYVAITVVLETQHCEKLIHLEAGLGGSGKFMVRPSAAQKYQACHLLLHSCQPGRKEFLCLWVGMKVKGINFLTSLNLKMMRQDQMSQISKVICFGISLVVFMEHIDF